MAAFSNETNFKSELIDVEMEESMIDTTIPGLEFNGRDKST